MRRNHELFEEAPRRSMRVRGAECEFAFAEKGGVVVVCRENTGVVDYRHSSPVTVNEARPKVRD